MKQNLLKFMTIESSRSVPSIDYKLLPGKAYLIMNEFNIGGFAVSTAGHDFGKCYVIFQSDNEYVYLVDGKIRTLNHLKKKKIKHMKLLDQSDWILADKVKNMTVKNEEIKRAIKLLQRSNSNKGGKSLLKDKEA